MLKEYYVGFPHPTNLPVRIGDGFSAETVTSARKIAMTRLSEYRLRYGLLCVIQKRSVKIIGTLKNEDGGYYAKEVVINGKTVLEDERAFDNCWIPLKKVKTTNQDAD